jgi:hypothetical protein
LSHLSTGRLGDVDDVERLSYSLNGGAQLPVSFESRAASASRLACLGDFNIDTLEREQLKAENRLTLTVDRKDGRQVKRTVDFPVDMKRCAAGSFRLDLSGVDHAQQAGQLVNGRWRVGRAVDGERCLEVLPEDAGLDRIILFGNDNLESGYTIRSRLQVNRWLRPVHNVGLLFKWNPHLQGDGTDLPSQWSTGLGYYYSQCRGLRIRIGVDVRLKSQREKLGDHVLGEGTLSPWRYRASRAYQKLTGGIRVIPQVVPGRPYWFELKVRRKEYALTVWPAGRSRPSPQVVVENPPELLNRGSAGIIAHQCAVRVFEFEIEQDRDTESVS